MPDAMRRAHYERMERSDMQTQKNTSSSTAQKPKREPKPLNGVDTPKLFAT